MTRVEIFLREEAISTTDLDVLPFVKVTFCLEARETTPCSHVKNYHRVCTLLCAHDYTAICSVKAQHYAIWSFKVIEASLCK